MSNELNLDKMKKSVCLHRWAYPILNRERSEFRYCCRTPPQQIDLKDLSEKKENYFSNNNYIIERRKEMLSGVRHKDCESCWSLEDRGVESPRVPMERFVSYMTDDNQKKVDWTDLNQLSRATYPLALEVMLDNACNMKCIYCNHHYSSLWAKEKIEFGEMTREEIQEEVPEKVSLTQDIFEKWLSDRALCHIDDISLIGGEPFLSKRFYEFCEDLIIRVQNSKRTKYKISLCIVTNLNLSDPQFERAQNYLIKLSHYFNLQLNLSMDSVESRAEYIRHGLSWSQWERNLDLLLQTPIKNMKISLLPAISILNVTSIKDLLVLAHKKYKEFGTFIYLKRNVIYDPNVHSYIHLPKSYSAYLRAASTFIMSIKDSVRPFENKETGWLEYANFLSELANSLQASKTSYKDIETTYNWFEENDRRRSSDMQTVFPELKKVWFFINMKKKYNSFMDWIT